MEIMIPTSVNSKAQITQVSKGGDSISAILQDLTEFQDDQDYCMSYVRVDVFVGGKRLVLKVQQDASYSISTGDSEKEYLAAAGNLRTESWYAIENSDGKREKANG